MRLQDVPAYYDRAAKHYDLLTSLVFRYLLRVERHRARSLDLLGNLNGTRVLDIGCGTGRSLPGLVERVGPHGQITAVDYSAGMLEHARRRVARHGWSQVKLVRADAVTLDGINGPFDAVTSAWCLGIVYDLDAALAQALSLLRPGGHFSVMDFQRSIPARGPLRWFYPLYSRALKKTGIDAPEDLDNERLMARWAGGQAFLRRQLDDIHYQEYLQGAGFILAGRKPDTATH